MKFPQNPMFASFVYSVNQISGTTSLPPANGVAVMIVVFLLLVELSSSQEETSFSGDSSELSSSTSSGISFRRNRSPFKEKNDLNIYTV